MTLLCHLHYVPQTCPLYDLSTFASVTVSIWASALCPTSTTECIYLGSDQCAAVAKARSTEQAQAVWGFEEWRRRELAHRQREMVVTEEQRMATLEALALSRESSRQQELMEGSERLRARQVCSHSLGRT
jgi:hypothetical protein